LTEIGLRNAAAFLVRSGVVEKEVKLIANGRSVYKTEHPIYDCYETNDTQSISNLRKELGFSQ